MFKILSVTALAAMVEGNADAQQRLVQEINNSPNVLWKAARSERLETESRSYGVHLSSSSDAVKQLPRHESDIRDEDVPKAFDSETNWPKCAKVIGDIRDQSNCGCCWAFAGASAASDRLCISTNGTVAVPLSAQDVCFCASANGCDGGQIDTPWNFIAKHGAVTGGQYNDTYPVGKGNYCSDFSLPHCHHHGPQGSDPYPAEGAPGCPSAASPTCPRTCDSDAAAPNNDFKEDKWRFAGKVQSASGEAGIQKAILAGGPVETAFTVYSDFENYAGGIYHHVTGAVAGGHAVKIVGWGEEGGTSYWKVANSWNPYWGEKGYFRIKRGDNECGIEDGVTFSPHTAKWSQGSGSTCTANTAKTACLAETGCHWFFGKCL